MTSREDARRATEYRVTRSAEKLFLRDGFRSTTIRGIAADAGVSVGTVMKVGDKSALLVSMFDRSIDRLHAQPPLPTKQHGAPGNGAPMEELYSALEPFLDVFASQMELSREYAAALVSGAHHSVVFQDLAAVLIRKIEDILRRGGMDEDLIVDAARTVYLSYLGALFFWAGRGSIEPEEAQELLKSALTFVSSVKLHG
ncbi:TetR/AcrR family transcriptional regulator [Rathayibacter rathayi]|uniref:TetR/AcrR family transcriptional regulator n=1 Tax=Rathayibacter rathayi TaxID=33887 RepID=A0ABX5AE11_RATRA|nr:TetR/AcrR family transcriptional regulator [Rathayibacter rathayi]AZZ48223.1 TetR/AcrR family transcriptional regulator [Rathayibacter rathayi]MWV75507.1 TetR family transcriptional regulator [Rathayibacter rathayi NCPPB 2980 = VKM Ac-1601]PPF48090.1 TetR/AcrR family transcriptional regulator [Rathayibacter rathayi]PPG70361.1 TetR/AcrR family transcriptional regulator [Rathayibacter rathayi]PPG77052.1 TetR/AcrR family transcriptional regulator [Rathayibacter rathayi]